MRNFRLVKILFLLAIFPLAFFAQSDGKISHKNKELTRIKSEIAELEKKIATYSTKEIVTGKELEKIEKQIFLYDKLISDLRNKITETEKTLANLDKKYAETESRISRIKSAFEKYAVWLYKIGEPTVWDYLADPKSFNENLEMKYYFNYFAENAAKKIDSLRNYENQISRLKLEKEKRREELQSLFAEKRKRKNELLAARKRKDKYLVKIRNDKKRARKIIEEKKQRQKQISALIARLIKEEEEARLRRMREIAARKKKKEKAVDEISYDYLSGVKFSSLKGKLAWPVNGKVTKRFGKIRNPKLKTVSVNNGIDIATRPNAKVKAVADGIVSAVEWLPGYGPVVIISHGNKFRSVYGFVSNFKVSKGDKVKAGQPLGTVTASVDGNVIHFEIWNKRKPENPEKWLKRR